MLDIRKIRENPDLYRDRLARRHTGDEKLIGHLLVLDEKRRKHLQEGEALKSERNRASKEIGAIKAKGGDIAEVSAKMKAVGEQIAKIDQELAGIETEQTDLLLRIPNVNHDSVPVGKGPEENRIERVVGQPASFDFKPKPHWEIGAQLGLIDLEAATRISGSGFIVFKGAGAPKLGHADHVGVRSQRRRPSVGRPLGVRDAAGRDAARRPSYCRRSTPLVVQKI